MQDLIDSIRNSQIISIGYRSEANGHLDSFISILDYYIPKIKIVGDMYLVRTNGTGAVEWTMTYGTINLEIGYAVQL